MASDNHGRVSTLTLVLSIFAAIGIFIAIDRIASHHALALACSIALVVIVAVHWIVDLRGKP